MKTEEGEDREHDDDKADKIDDTVHVHVLRSFPTSTNLRCSVSESIYLSRKAARPVDKIWRTFIPLRTEPPSSCSEIGAPSMPLRTADRTSGKRR